MGNLLGILIEEKLSIGLAIVRIITKHDATKLIEYLKSMEYGVTIVDAEGVKGPVKLIFAVVKRVDLKKILGDIERIHPHAFYSVKDVRSVGEAILPSSKNRRFFRAVGKGK
ncbi:MAG: DUF2179 domain-containing protein [Candidatus Thermoplasmatota archaeon]|nr:DUF2179 domain-containing protein [Candidatus Thermoplasmatota archaeon]